MKPIIIECTTLALLVASAPSANATVESGISATRPSPSPNAGSVVFVSNLDGQQSNLWISDISGNSLRKLTTLTTGARDPAWSPTGGAIAFSSASVSGSDIFSVHPDGSVLTQLTSNSIHNKQPAWSPDGSKIAFVSDRGGTNDIWIMNADGSMPRRVTRLPGQENHPSFSPAGDAIVFSETVSGHATLMVVNLDGSGLRSLTNGGFNDWNPSWSTFGIAFSTNRNSEHWTIWQIQPDGSGMSSVGAVMGLDPVRMPDGRILFSDEDANSAALSAVSILDPTSGAKTLVLTLQGMLTAIDIRPKSTENRINAESNGTVPVAILSQMYLDPTVRVDQGTLTFGRTGSENSFVRCAKKFKDVNGDGVPDLVCRFKISTAGFQSGDAIGILRFKDVDGTLFEGRGSVVIGPPDDPDDFAGGDDD